MNVLAQQFLGLFSRGGPASITPEQVAKNIGKTAQAPSGD